MRPMLATPSSVPGVPPIGDEWSHEVKWDGIRLLTDVRDGRPRFFNRSEADVTSAYPDLTAAARELPGDALFDGEVVALDASGRPSFGRIASRFHLRDDKAVRAARSIGVTYMVFDLLRLGGTDLVRVPLRDRRALLDGLDLPGVTDGAFWQVPPAYDDGVLLSAATAAQDLEGVVSKRLDSTYQPGVRSLDWVKAPHRRELVAVIGGWVPEADSPNRLGSVWVGHPTDEATFETAPVLYPIARVGSGLPHAQRDALLDVLRTITRDTAPFDPLPDGPEVRRTTWVEPVLAVQVRYLGIAESGVLRQPVLRALRPDVTPVEAPYADLLAIEN